MSSLWLLEAKPFAEEDRSAAATSAKFWLKPGAYSVGRAAAGADVPVEEDRSISRRHAELVVPPAAEWQAAGEPHVLVTDKSKYGTSVSPSGSFREPQLQGGAQARVAPNCMLRFGFKSPFKLYHQDWVLFLCPEQRQGAAPAELAALEEAAGATGLPLTDKLPDHPGTRVLVRGATPLRINGTLLLGLLRGYPVVQANWLLEWQRQRVWSGSRPQESAYPVQLQYADAAGHLKALPSADHLANAMQQQPLAGRALLWLPPARGDAALVEAAHVLGASNSNVAASGRASAAAKASGAVLVLGSESDALPAAYKKLPWTTPDLLLAGILEGNVGAAVHPPAGEGDVTPPAGAKKGRGGNMTPGTATGSRGRGKGRGKAAAAEQDGGSETDVSEDLSHLRTQRQLAADAANLPTAAAASLPQQQSDAEADAPAAPASHKRGRKAAAAATAMAVPAAALEASGGRAAAGGRKRRNRADKDEEEEEEEEQAQPQSSEEAVRPTPAKRRRQAAAAAAAVQQQQEEVPAAIEAPAAAPQAVSAAKPGAAVGGRRRGSQATAAVAATTAVAVAEVAAATTAAEVQGADGEEVAVEEEEDGPTRIAFVQLIPARLPPPAAVAAAPRGRGSGSSNGDAGPNFKAFRKAGSGGAAEPAAAVARAVIGFDAQPYEEEGPVNAEAFLKAEAERRRRVQQADELFTANVKARKAPQLPDPDGDTPPKGRGRGGKKAAAAPPAGTQSILNFLPAASAGRGRGRSGGRGRGRGRS